MANNLHEHWKFYGGNVHQYHSLQAKSTPDSLSGSRKPSNNSTVAEALWDLAILFVAPTVYNEPYLWRGNQMSDTPKSAYEIVMERLRSKDVAAGVEERQISDEQKAAIAEARKVYEARAAERRILHESAIAGTSDPAEREKLEERYRRDMERFARDRDSKIRKIREGSAKP
jgi:hypothetical protein